MMITASNERMVIGDQYGPSTTLTVKNIVKSDTSSVTLLITSLVAGFIHHSISMFNVSVSCFIHVHVKSHFIVTWL